MLTHNLMIYDENTEILTKRNSFKNLLLKVGHAYTEPKFEIQNFDYFE